MKLFHVDERFPNHSFERIKEYEIKSSDRGLRRTEKGRS